MTRWSIVVVFFARLAQAQHASDEDLAGAFGPQPELKVFLPERNVPAPPLPEDPNAQVRAAFETDFAAAQRALEGGDAAAAREAVPSLELSAFLLGGPERVRVQQLARAAATAAGDPKALPAIVEKWLAACGPNEVEACRGSALEALAKHDKARAERVRAADACVAAAERAPGKRGPACLEGALALYKRAEDSLMVSRVELANALALTADPTQLKAAKRALTQVAERIDGRNGHVRRAAFDARARLELAEGSVEAAARSALAGAEAWANTMAPEQRYWARTPLVEQACAAYDTLKGKDACRALEKQLLGFYVFHDFSREHLPDRQLISHEKLVEVNEHYGVLIRDCLAAEIRELADRAAVSYLVQWLVLGTGRVDNFHSLSSEQDQSRFVTCLREQFGYWRYPSHEGDPHRIKQGFSVKSRVRETEETEPVQLE
jgi:hypothetical protein